jgi:hypothetical protein
MYSQYEQQKTLRQRVSNLKTQAVSSDTRLVKFIPKDNILLSRILV